MYDHRVIVCGTRRWSDRERIAYVLSELQIDRGWTPLIVHGAARGADRIAGEEAGKLGFHTEEHPAQWDLLGKRAGFVRNEEMAKAGASLCIAFWDGSSVGTQHMMDLAERYGIPTQIEMKAVTA